MAADLKDVALKTVQRKVFTSIDDSETDTRKSRLYKDYYSLDSGEPIALEILSKRIRRRFSDIDKSSALAMMDLWFLHAQWTSFYSRTDSFSKYIHEELQISKTHAYSILASVNLLNDFFIHKGKTDSEVNSFVNQICASIEDIGIKKLSILSKINSPDVKFEYLERLLGGEEIAAEALRQKPEKKEKVEAPTAVTLTGNEVKIGETLVLTFQSENEVIRKAVFKVIGKCYQKFLQTKKV